MEWISVNDRLPNEKELKSSRCWDFLCNVIIPENGGSYQNRYIVLSFDILDKKWNCQDMIVTHWASILKIQDKE